MRCRDIALAGVLLKHFRAQDLVSEVLHGFWREELEGLRDSHWRDAHSFVVPDVFHRHYALRGLESQMLVRMERRSMWLGLATPVAGEWRCIDVRDCCWHFEEGNNHSMRVDKFMWLLG